MENCSIIISGTSITRRQNPVAKYIATQPILDLCEQATWRPGARVSRRWWYQVGIELEGLQKHAAVSVTISDTETDSEEESDGDTTGAAGGGEEESQ